MSRKWLVMIKWLFICSFLFLSLPGRSQDTSGSERVVVEGRNVKLSYDKPAMTGLAVFGQVVPYGKVWTGGGKASTQITFEKDGSFGGLPVKTGTYTLLVIPQKKEWTMILNSAAGSGVFDYQRFRDKDVLKITVPVRTISSKKENLTYRFSDTQMIIEWEHTQVVVAIGVD